MPSSAVKLKLVSDNNWRRWRDPREGKDDDALARDREVHRAAILAKARAEMADTMGFRSGQRAPVALLAAISGLSEGTVRKYVRKSHFGKRGPLLTTYLALKLLNRV